MFGLVVIEVMTPSGHLSNINEIINVEQGCNLTGFPQFFSCSLTSKTKFAVKNTDVISNLLRSQYFSYNSGSTNS